jgi:hypothetical protein
MLTLNNVITNLNNIATSHGQIDNFFYGEAYDFAASGTTLYNSMVVEQVPNKISNGVQTMSFKIWVMGLVQKGDRDRQEVASDTQSIIMDILAILDRTVGYEWNVNTDVTLNDFVDTFQDELTGWWFQLDLRVPNALDRCQVPLISTLAIKDGASSGGGSDWVNPNALSITVLIDSGLDFTLPCGNIGTYDAIATTDEGNVFSITTYNDSDLTFSFATEGSHTISFTGDLPWIYFNNGGDKLKITDITQWG